MLLYVALALLFCLVLVLTVAEHREVRRRQKRLELLQQLSSSLLILLEQRQNKQTEEKIGNPKPNGLTSEPPNTIPPGSYEEYLKNGGTDDPLTWLYGTTNDKLFP